MKKWDVVLLSYPFTDLSGVKVRPAVVVSPSSDNASSQDGVFLLVTSNTTRMSVYDVIVDSGHPEYPGTGFKVSSAVRINKIITLHQRLVKRTLGVIGPQLQAEISENLRRYFQLSEEPVSRGVS